MNLTKRIEELERRVRELEARPLVHYVPVITPVPSQPYPWPAYPAVPSPWPAYPWTVTATEITVT